ncbi:hypothetical protein KKF47_00215 [Patescibacteria group bacterium]|nr:hypothetical protein [Patescibacteria group bacterium]MBU4466481.1 hypothetical protein [Patescibacteria group bacterium]
MGIKKYKYYFKKPRSEIVKDILYWLLTAGAVYIAASNPSFVRNILKARKKWKNYPRKKIYDTFYRLKNQGLIEIFNDGSQIHINLTDEGKRKAGYFQINDLKIKKPKNWDKKWRIVIFDIAELKKLHRESFRGKIKELGFRQLQKSVWVYPFDCRAEIELLREFFGLSKKDLRIIVAQNIEGDEELKENFKV